MPLRFLKLFSSDKPSADGLTQPQREAIADLLHYLVYADSHIAAREGDYVNETIQSLSLDAALSFSAYEQRSIAAARQAKENPDHRREFIASIAARLDTSEARARALELGKTLVWIDGTNTAHESAALADLQAALNA
jgi:hypothetical protein